MSGKIIIEEDPQLQQQTQVVPNQKSMLQQLYKQLGNCLETCLEQDANHELNLKHQIQSLNDKYQSVCREKEEHEKEMTAKVQKCTEIVNELKEKYQEKSMEYETLQTTNKKLEDDVQNLNEKLAQMKLESENMKDELKSIKENHSQELWKLNHEIASTGKKLSQELQHSSQLQSEKLHLVLKEEGLQFKIEQLNAVVHDLKKDYQGLFLMSKDLAEELNKEKAETGDLLVVNKSLIAANDAINEENIGLKKQVAELNARWCQMKSIMDTTTGGGGAVGQFVIVTESNNVLPRKIPKQMSFTNL